MRNSISKGISSRFAELSRNGGGVRVVKLALCAALFAAAVWAQPPVGFGYRIDTVAGTGERGFSGDGGPADQAQLNFPVAVAVDGTGNLFITDESNERIRRVDPTGIITTLAGTGERGFSGDGGPGQPSSA